MSNVSLHPNSIAALFNSLASFLLCPGFSNSAVYQMINMSDLLTTQFCCKLSRVWNKGDWGPNYLV